MISEFVEIWFYFLFAIVRVVVPMAFLWLIIREASYRLR